MAPAAEPWTYFPIPTGRYEVAAGLRPLGTDLGNGEADGWVFQFDRRFPEFRENKRRCRAGRLAKYHGVHDLPPAVEGAVNRFIAARLAEEHPDHFRLKGDPRDGWSLQCALTGETVSERSAPAPYVSTFDALSCQVQEDLAVVCTAGMSNVKCQVSDGPKPGHPTPNTQHPGPIAQRPTPTNYLAAYHVCAPSHWVPEEKLGRDFAAIHAPVPGIERLNRAADVMVDAMVNRGPFVRFVWGVETSSRLNHHPHPPDGVDPEEWRSPPFDSAAKDPFVLRVERQVTWGLPEVGASLFVIRLSHLPGSAIRRNPERRSLLRSALAGMSPESRDYKGIAGYVEPLLAWLDA